MGREEGLTTTLAGRTRILPWKGIERMRADEVTVVVRGKDASGRRRKVRMTGSADEIRRVTDTTLDRAPGLALLAWGLGRPEVHAPVGAVPDANRPTKVQTGFLGLVIRTADGSKLTIEHDHPHLERLTDLAMARLKPLIRAE